MPRSDSLSDDLFLVLWRYLRLPRRASPVPCVTVSAFHVPYAGGFFAAVKGFPPSLQFFTASVAFAKECVARLPLAPCPDLWAYPGRS